jgi:DNA-binding transcriptional regulator YiaG
MSDLYRYRECGLPKVWLANGFQRHKTPYGEGVSIHDVEGLHRAIGLAIAAKREPLTGPEIRFLRKEMDVAQSELGDLLGLSDQTVALWERSKGKITKPAEHLLRLLYREHATGMSPVREFIQRLKERDLSEETGILAREDARGWDTEHMVASAPHLP